MMITSSNLAIQWRLSYYYAFLTPPHPPNNQITNHTRLHCLRLLAWSNVETHELPSSRAFTSLLRKALHFIYLLASRAATLAPTCVQYRLRVLGHNRIYQNGSQHVPPRVAVGGPHFTFLIEGSPRVHHKIGGALRQPHGYCICVSRRNQDRGQLHLPYIYETPSLMRLHFRLIGPGGPLRSKVNMGVDAA
jgi:hypothetical protein